MVSTRMVKKDGIIWDPQRIPVEHLTYPIPLWNLSPREKRSSVREMRRIHLYVLIEGHVDLIGETGGRN